MNPTTHPEFFNKLVTFLQKTKMEPRFSRELANWVKHCKAFRVIRIWPKVYDPKLWCADRTYHQRPANRYYPGHILLTDREGDLFFEAPSRNAHRGGPDLEWSYRGQDLASITNAGGAAGLPQRSASWMSGGGSKDDWNWEDITTQFWETYMQIGVCLFDWTHLDYGGCRFFRGPEVDSARFRMLDGQTCQCKFCGDILHLHRQLRIEIRTKETWSHDPVDGANETFRCTRCHRRHPIADLHQDLAAAGPSKRLTRGDGTTYTTRTQIRIKMSKLCPSCFLAYLGENPGHRRALLPSEVLKAPGEKPQPGIMKV